MQSKDINGSIVRLEKGKETILHARTPGKIIENIDREELWLATGRSYSYIIVVKRDFVGY